MFKTLIIALMAVQFVSACEVEFQPERNPGAQIASDSDVGFTDDAGRQWERGERNCFTHKDCPPGQWCLDREWCYKPPEDDIVANSESPGSDASMEGEGEPPLEGEGEGEGPPPEGEGEGEGDPLCVPTDEVCDQLDNDCDGDVDEVCACVGATIQACGLDVGECRPGLQSCEEDGTWGSCAGSVDPVQELCDGLDNDCDGEMDEGLGESSCGIGECANTAPNCVNGASPGCVPLPPSPESCDGLDNDCDGEMDEGLGRTACGIGACQTTVPNCLNGREVRCFPRNPSPESCDGLDNDCDGEMDEGNPGSGENCDTGDPGICAAGILNCEQGGLVCTPLLDPMDEACDQLDNDCDGDVDEGVAPEGWSCIPPTGPDGFLMGSTPEDAERDDDEEPPHRVFITRGFLMKQTEVTQREWRTRMGDAPSGFRNCGNSCPVEQVSWYGAISYANTLSRAEGLEECYALGDASWPGGLDCMGYRLPTEAEWEYAARAGNPASRYAEPLEDLGWYEGNSGAMTHPVGQKAPNVWGLYDMYGNVWEFMWDRYGFYEEGDVEDPTGSLVDYQRVIRGGAYNHLARDCRSASRVATDPHSAGANIGIRLVRTIQ